MKTPVVAPPQGQSFVDEEGVYWTVRSIRRAKYLEGFFLVSLDHGKTPECVDGNVVLAPREFESLVRTRGFKLVAPGIAHPVPFADPAFGAAADHAGSHTPGGASSGPDALQ